MRCFGLSFDFFSMYIERFARQYRYSTRVSPALLKLRSPSHNYTQQNTTHIYTHIHAHIHVHIDVYTHIHMHISINQYVNISK